MKKLLLATVAFALIAPTAQAEIKLDLGGFFKGYAGYASNNNNPSSTRDFDVKRKSQVFFQGETTLDNGLTVGYNGQLMQDNNVDPANAGGDNAMEQSYLYFSGNWGRVNLGRENGAAYLLQVTAPAADANLDGSDIEFSFFNTNGANIRQDYAHTGALQDQTGVLNRGEDFQYADKITYLTPKFNGFQAGVSYTPQVAPRNQLSYFGQSSTTAGTYEDLMEAAARYDGEFSGVGVHLGAGYTRADGDDNSTQDFRDWNAGAKFTYEGFGLGVAHTDRRGDITNSTATAALGGQVKNWVVGGDYTYGAYTFGATYFNSRGDSTVAGNKDDYERYAVGSSYTFGPGMKFNGSVAHHDLTAAAGANNNKAWVFAVGTDIQF